jgi:hypothetical protein
MRQLPRGSFFGKARLFLKNAWHFKDIFIEFEAFLKCCEAFKKIRRFLKIFKEK